MILDNVKKVHFIGIGGIGVSAVAKMMMAIGKKVVGSDLYCSVITDKLKTLGAKIKIGQHSANLSKDTDLVIYSAAVPANNPERLKVKQLNILEMSYAEFLGWLSKQKQTLAITGTNGKTTTTAILGQVLIDSGLDTTLIVGSQLKRFNGNFHLGKTNYLTVEADEYKANMLKIDPWSIILTSIEEDHLDFYKNLDDIAHHFQKFTDKLPANGFLLYNADDENIKKLKLPQNSFGCSLKKQTDYHAKNIKLASGGYQFQVLKRNQLIDEFALKIPGQYNILNSLMVIGLCQQMKIDLKKVKNSLANFNGLWRRFEILGELKDLDNVLVISDYTHHPAAIKKTLKAAKEFYPRHRLFLVYQPHQHDRTKKLFNQFLNCFNQADFVVLNEIYDVAGRKYKKDEKVSSKNIVEKINRQNVIYSPNFSQTKELIYQNIKPHDLLLIMGAGDIDNLARELV